MIILMLIVLFSKHFTVLLSQHGITLFNDSFFFNFTTKSFIKNVHNIIELCHMTHVLITNPNAIMKQISTNINTDNFHLIKKKFYHAQRAIKSYI